MRWVTRCVPAWSERARFFASAVAGVLTGALLVVASGLPLMVFFPALFGAPGLYVGLLLVGTGWRHHVATRLVFRIGVLVVIGASRLVR